MERDYADEIEAGESVRAVGWLKEVRDLGSLKFMIIYDKTGEVQVTAKEGDVSDNLMENIDSLNKESFISVRGKAVESEKAPGGLEVIPEEIEEVSRAPKKLPVDMSGKIGTNLDKRLDWRFLDMRRPEVRQIFQFQSKVVNLLNDFMQNQDFTRLSFSKLTQAATEGGTDYFPVVYFNKEAFLAQSPQLYKESVLVSGLDRVYDIGPVYRAEPHHTTRHICEYLSFDYEMIAEDLSEVLDMEEKLFKYVFKKLNQDEEAKRIMEENDVSVEPPEHIPRITFQEANEILKEMHVETEEHDLTPEGEKKLCEHFEEKEGVPFVFVTEFPFEKKPFYIMRKGENSSLSFDLLYNGLEITSGGIREHRYEERVKNLKDKGLDPEKFDHVRFFKYGMPPHGGLAIGIERLTQKILELANVREATLLPRDPKRLKP